MAHNSNNVHAYNGTNYAVWTAPFGTVMSGLPGTSPSASAYEVGLLSDAGITEGHNLNETDVYDLAGSLVRVIRNQEQRPFTFEAIEYNAVVGGLIYPGSTTATTGATAEVQTVTITGSPTGGTFTLTLAGYGSYTATYNIAPSALQTALQAAWGIGVTVTGTAGTSYVLTFPTGAGNVPQATATNAFTGGTTPTVAVATTTPGITGTTTRSVGAGTGRNLRTWAIDLIDGNVSRRFVINNGEATQSGTVTYSGGGIAIYQFSLQPYLDTSNNFFQVISNDPAEAGLFA